MKYFSEDEKKTSHYANLDAIDCVLQRYDLSSREINRCLKSTLLFSNLYLTDVHFCTHKEIWKLLRDEHFRLLLQEGFKGNPAITIGLGPRGGEQSCTPIESIDGMIKDHMIFPSVITDHNIRKLIETDQLQNAEELFKKINAEETYNYFEMISNNFYDGKIKIWKAEHKPGQFFELIQKYTNDIINMEKDIDPNFIKLTKKYNEQLTDDKRDTYSRSKAEKELWKIIFGVDAPPDPTQPPNTTGRDFETMVIDFTYNHNIADTNPGSIIYLGCPLMDEVSRNYYKFLKKNGIVHDFNTEKYIYYKSLTNIDIIDNIDYNFIYSLRTKDAKKRFERNIDRINKTKGEKRDDILNEHLKFIFDEYVLYYDLGEDYYRDFWKSYENYQEISSKFEEYTGITGFFALILGTFVPPPYSFLINTIGSTLGLTGGISYVSRKIFSSKYTVDYFKYKNNVRGTKNIFADSLVKIVGIE